MNSNHSRRHLWTLLVSVIVALLSCARNPAPDKDNTGPDLQHAEVTLQVYNHHWLDVDIYIVSASSSEERVGTVQGSSTRVFSLPWRRIGGRSQLRLKADPIGTRAVLYTEHLQIQPGSVINWTIEGGFTGSRVEIY